MALQSMVLPSMALRFPAGMSVFSQGATFRRHLGNLDWGNEQCRTK